MAFSSTLLLAVTGLPAFVASAPAISLHSLHLAAVGGASHSSSQPDSHITHLFKKKRGAADVYCMYSGNGQTSWPDINHWVAFDQMFEANTEIMKGSCTQWSVPNNSDEEIMHIKQGVQTVADETGVDSRFVLAVLLQESNGCVRAPTTNNGVRNPGLMQDHNGQATCNDLGVVQTPCPADMITQMRRDGVAGTAAGDGLQQTLAQAPGTGSAKYYGAARIYNSGSIAPSGDLGHGIATHCYASDIANRLCGWVFAQKECTLDGTPAPAYGKPVQYGSSRAEDSATEAPKSNPAPATYTIPEPAPSPTFTTVYVPSVSETLDISVADSTTSSSSKPGPEPSSYSANVAAANVAAANVEATSAAAPQSMKAPGVTSECAQYYTVRDGDFCESVARAFGITFGDLRGMNIELDANCSNLWKGYDYCVRWS